MTSPAPQPADGERNDPTRYESHQWGGGETGEECVACGVHWQDCEAPCPGVDPNRGVADPEVSIGAPVVHRCQYRAAAADRKLYADEFYRQLNAMREGVLAIHKPVPTWTDSTVDTETGETEQNALYADDGTLLYAPDHRTHCTACPVDTPWPCPTAQAVEVGP